MRRKVTLKIFTPLLHDFESQLDALHMKRDAFLDHLINRELPFLADDLAGKRLAISAKRFIAQSLKRFGTSQINVQLNSTTAEHLDNLAHTFNLVRDSFINRLLYFSIGSDALLKYFEVRSDNSVTDTQSVPMGYLQAIHEIQIDPLVTLRRAVKAKHGIGLYQVQLPLELAAFECYLDEEIFWEKYGAPRRASDSTGDLLQSFESTIYRDKVADEPVPTDVIDAFLLTRSLSLLRI